MRFASWENRVCQTSTCFQTDNCCSNRAWAQFEKISFRNDGTRSRNISRVHQFPADWRSWHMHREGNVGGNNPRTAMSLRQSYLTVMQRYGLAIAVYYCASEQPSEDDARISLKWRLHDRRSIREAYCRVRIRFYLSIFLSIRLNNFLKQNEQYKSITIRFQYQQFYTLNFRFRGYFRWRSSICWKLHRSFAAD